MLLSSTPPNVFATTEEKAHPSIARGTPQPGVLGDTLMYAFPGANNSNGNGANGAGDINKLLLSTSGLALINTLLEEGKLGSLIGQVSQLVRSDGKVSTDTASSNSDTKTAESTNIVRSLPTEPPKL